MAAAVIKTQQSANIPASNADMDLWSYDRVAQANNTPALRHGFPDPTKDESFLGSMNFKDDNPADTRVNSTLNFEIGRSIRHRFRYLANGDQLPKGITDEQIEQLDWRYIIYVPAYKMANKDGSEVLVGPYAGQVWRPEDPFNPAKPGLSAEKAAALRKAYTKIAFKGDLLAVINHLYDNSGQEQGAIQTEYGKDNEGNGKYGYPYTAIVDYKFGAECVIGISAKGLQPGGLPPGVISIPAGFASYEGKIGDKDYHASPGAELADQSLAGKATSMNGKAMSGDMARDSFFKVNASDCCNNAKVILSGTYSTIDDVRPNVGVDLEEAQTAARRTERVRYVARVPNETADASNATVAAEADLDSPNSRIDPTKTPAERGYGDYCNQAHTWDVEQSGLSNPVDAQGRSFLDVTGGGAKPPIMQNHRMNLNICADDNVGEAMVNGKVVYPISHLSYKMIRPDGGEDESRVLIDPANNNQAMPEAACVTVPYIFKADPPPGQDVGWYTLVVTARDLSGNERVMRTRIPVKRETAAFQQIESEHQKTGN
ncbi:MAG: hypothetical protein HY814_00665 [Candidatus Riflebacteria bacterium]|nr:hypothetical protein [Candidatus Riflebacteria bacterium]